MLCCCTCAQHSNHNGFFLFLSVWLCFLIDCCFFVFFAVFFSYLLASIGLTGVTALGTRWLANNYKKLPKGVASALQLISKVLKASQEFAECPNELIEQ